LDYFAKKDLLPPVVGEEGAEGVIDASILAAYPDRQIREEVADYFVQQGELTGAGAYAVKNSRSDMLRGIEDLAYYRLHKKLFQTTFIERQDLLEQLTGFEKPLTRLQKKLYSRDVRRLSNEQRAYQAGTLAAADFAEQLIKKAQAIGCQLPPERYLVLPL